MANLFSNDKIISVSLKPEKYEVEDWIITSLIYNKNHQKFFEISSPFLRLVEFKQITQNMRDVLRNPNFDKVYLQFTEPNFELKLEKNNNTKTYKIFFKYRTVINYANGSIVDLDKDTKQIVIDADVNEIETFLERKI